MEKAIAYAQTAHIHHWWREIYNLGISFQTKLNSRASITTLKQMLFPINPSDWEMILSEFKKMTNTYLITPIKRTENKKTPTNWGVFFKTMIGKMAYS
jgi:hypothetical protein